MKFIPGPLAAELSGKLGGTVASHNRGGAYFRRRSKPVIVTSEAAEKQKGAFATVSAAWKELGDAAREAWKIWAANNPVVDRVGQKVTLDGHAAYLQCNCNQIAAGYPTNDLPPVVGPPDGLATVDVDGAIVSGHLWLNFTPSQATTSQILMMRAAVVESAARNYVKGKLRVIGYSDEAMISQIDILGLTEARLGTIQNGEYLHVTACTYDPATGLTSLPLSAKAEISGHA